MDQTKRTEKVYTLVRRDGEDGVYARVGTATWEDSDRILIELDALPISGHLVIGVRAEPKGDRK